MASKMSTSEGGETSNWERIISPAAAGAAAAGQDTDDRLEKQLLTKEIQGCTRLELQHVILIDFLLLPGTVVNHT